MLFEIFTDGSSNIKGDFYESSSAFVIYTGNTKLVSGGKYHENGTNNTGEIQAILLGLKCLRERLTKVDKTKLKPPYKIVVIGDSSFAIEGCRSWIYKWVRQAKNGALINSSGDEVASGSVFMEIYKDFLVSNDYKIIFRHVKSHKLDTGFSKYMSIIDVYFNAIKTGSKPTPLPSEIYQIKSFKAAMKSYREKNGITITNEELLRLLYYNKECDALASEYLKDRKKKKVVINKSKK